MRLIDADALLERYDLNKATKYGNEDKKQQDFSYSTMMMYEIADMIDDAPTVDAVEQKHGHWEQYKDYANFGYSCCSYCGKKYALPQLTYKYCPECGAKMDEVTE